MKQSYGAPSVAAGLIRLARLKAGVSQGELARAAGLSPQMISAYERGRRAPTLGTLSRILAGAGFELRMQLAPYDPHDEVLAELESQRSPQERQRRDRQIAAWHNAVPVR
jgi:transcriptional regulator with XRE-family HTH domain